MRFPFARRDPTIHAQLQTLDEQDRYEFVVRHNLALLRRRIRRRAGARSGSAAQRQAADKHARGKSRRLKKTLLANRRPINKNVLLQKRRRSPILDGLDRKREGRWKNFAARRMRRQPYHLAFENFNFLDNPIESMEQIARLSKSECTEIEIRLDFDDEYCLDAGAFLVLAEFWNQLSPVIRSGRMSSPMQKVVSATGIDEDTRIQLQGVRNHDDVWSYPIQRRRPKFSTRDEEAQLNWQEREVIADQVVGSVDEWVAVPTGDPALDLDEDSSGWELSDVGKQNISSMVGELLCNAERHSQPGSDDGDWSIMAFMARRDGANGEKTHQCHIAFLSVGQSMAESLMHADPHVKAYVDKYVSLHRGSGFSAGTLATVAALQDRVTGDPDAYANNRGGTGLQDVMDFADDLAGGANGLANARVTIVSGNSCIRLRPPILKGRRDDSTKPRYQWCNAANDPGKSPDRDVVFDMPRYFAGTLVTVAFTLDLSLERDETEGKDNADD